MSEFDDFDFIDSYGDAVEVKHENQLPRTMLKQQLALVLSASVAAVESLLRRLLNRVIIRPFLSIRQRKISL